MAAFESQSSEYDSNAILAELDRVLRSANLAERCDGILKLPSYFEKLPFQFLITSAFLKLTEAFRNGSCLTRKWILHVAEKSDKHLHKIISRDELMNRILMVSHSNDPNARALTLRLFASFARILADRKQMHHVVCSALDSNDADELHAAIFAAQCFAKHSPEFGRSVFDKAMQMLLRVDVPADTKLLIVPILEHFCADSETSQKALVFCRDEFLPQSRSSIIIGSVLIALTKLAVHAIIIAPLQLELLLTYVQSRKASKKVTLTALDCLHFLAKETPHLWTKETLMSLADFCERTEKVDNETLLRALQVFATLAKNPVSRLWRKEIVTSIVDLCGRHCHSTSHWILSESCVIATNMMGNVGDASSRVKLMDILIKALTAALSTWPWQSGDSETLKATKNLLGCVLKLAKLNPAVAPTLASCLISIFEQCSDASRLSVTECVLALCDADLAVAESLQNQQLALLTDPQLITKLLLVPKSSIALLNRRPVSLESLRDRCTNAWEVFLVGRRALRYGYASIAKEVFSFLQEQVTMEQSNWIKALSLIGSAEENLSLDDGKSRIDRLSSAVYSHQLALIYTKAAITASYPVWFPVAFVNLRQRFLSAVIELHTVWNVAVLIPSPASGAVDPSLPENKMKRLIAQLSNCEKIFGDICLDYEALTRRCFDADEGTIELLKLLRTQSFLVQQAVGSIAGKIEGIGFAASTEPYNAQTRILAIHLERMANEIKTLQTNFDSITKEAVQHVLAITNHLCFEAPFFTPRFFFQHLQSTTIKLSLSPKPTDRDNSVKVPSDQRFLLNVEGVIVISGAKAFRRIDKVIVTVAVHYNQSVPTLANGKPRGRLLESGDCLDKAVPLVDDYFAADFMLDFAASGAIDVRVGLVDNKGTLWDGNAEEHLKIKLLPTAA